MKPMRTKRFGWLVVGVALLLSLKVTTHAQGRPDIVWMAGGHASAVNSVVFSPDGSFLSVFGSRHRNFPEVFAHAVRISVTLPTAQH